MAGGRGGGRRVGYHCDVAGGAEDTVIRHTQFGGHDLCNHGVQALAHLSTAVVDLHTAVGVHMHQRAGLVEQRRG